MVFVREHVHGTHSQMVQKNVRPMCEWVCMHSCRGMKEGGGGEEEEKRGKKREKGRGDGGGEGARLMIKQMG